MAGFYGNITNTARTQFQFDVVYPNRYTMDRNATTDGIYVGRYVLVEYDQDYNTKENFTQVYISDKDEFQWYNNSSRLKTITKGQLGTFSFDGEIIHPIVFVENEDDGSIVFYEVTNERDFEGSIEPATFKMVAIIEGNSSNYGENFNIDKITYGTARGFDSTVWMKSYVDGKEKYIMIAELNTVVPTFKLFADQPSMSPVQPHFDEQSTNIYYPIHWQTNWGFRIAAAEPNEISNWNTKIDTTYPTDEVVTYIKSSVNEENLKYNYTTKNVDYEGAIYYNKAGFSSKDRVRSDVTDKISLTATGISGNKYNKHPNNEYDLDGNPVGVECPDILELAVMLPSIGNTISDVWDIVYGTNRRLDLEYKYVNDTTLKEKSLNTLAGCINHYHDVLGQIILKSSINPLTSNPTESDYENHYIYEYDGKYYYIHKEITYSYENDAIIGTENGVAYSFVEIPNFGTDITSIYRLILDIKQILATSVETTFDRNTVQGCINTINKVIDLFETTFSESAPLIMTSDKKIATATWVTEQGGEAYNWGNGQTVSLGDDASWLSCRVDGESKEIIVQHENYTIGSTETSIDLNEPAEDTIITYAPIVDNMGHIVGKNTEITILPYGFKTVAVGNSSDDVISDMAHSMGFFKAENTQDTVSFKPSNKWIKMQSNNDNKTVSVSHEVHSFDEGKSGTLYGLSADKNISELDVDNSFIVPNFKFDEAGHIISASEHTIVLPENFSTIEITNSGNKSVDIKTAQNAQLTADSLIDTITIDTGNRWITMVGDENNDKFTIYHAAAGGDEEHTTYVPDTENGNEEPKFGEVFTIPEVKYDETGHIYEVSTHTVKIPLPSLNDFTATNASVITGMEMNTNEGEITITMANIGNRYLTDYVKGSNSDAIAATDTVNEAFGKIQVQMDIEIERAKNIEQSIQSDISTLDDKIDQEITNRETAVINLNDAIEALDFAAIGGDGKYIASIEQSNGQINATWNNLPDYTNYWNRIDTLETQQTNDINDLVSFQEKLYDNDNGDINILKAELEAANERIAALELSLTDVLSRLEALESSGSEPIPEEEVTE